MPLSLPTRYIFSLTLAPSCPIHPFRPPPPLGRSPRDPPSIQIHQPRSAPIHPSHPASDHRPQFQRHPTNHRTPTPPSPRSRASTHGGVHPQARAPARLRRAQPPPCPIHPWIHPASSFPSLARIRVRRILAMPSPENTVARLVQLAVVLHPAAPEPQRPTRLLYFVRAGRTTSARPEPRSPSCARPRPQLPASRTRPPPPPSEHHRASSAPRPSSRPAALPSTTSPRPMLDSPAPLSAPLLPLSLTRLPPSVCLQSSSAAMDASSSSRSPRGRREPMPRGRIRQAPPPCTESLAGVNSSPSPHRRPPVLLFLFFRNESSSARPVQS